MTTPVHTTATPWAHQITHPRGAPVAQLAGHAVTISDLITTDGAATLRAELEHTATWTCAGIDGRPGTPTHSRRTHLHDPSAAAALWERLAGHLGPLRTRGRHHAVGLNPRFRVIAYTDDGALVPHIDGSWCDPDTGHISLASCVIYLTTPHGGATRFIGDPTPLEPVGVPVTDGFAHDWDHLADDNDVTATVAAVTGTALVFDHSLLHDTAPSRGDKWVLRTDVMYRNTTP